MHPAIKAETVCLSNPVLPSNSLAFQTDLNGQINPLSGSGISPLAASLPGSVACRDWSVYVVFRPCSGYKWSNLLLWTLVFWPQTDDVGLLVNPKSFPSLYLLAISAEACSHFNLSRPIKQLKLHHNCVVLLSVNRYQLDTDI